MTIDAAVQRAAIVCTQVSWSIVTRDHQTKRVAPFLTGRLNCQIRIDNRARVHGRDRSLKNIDAFEKERSLLRKEDRKALISGYDELIGFDLREVGIDCQIYSNG